ncbi:MAG TPA: hypothetical protein VIK89_07255, partial [Cytophagaceae bacterium]
IRDCKADKQISLKTIPIVLGVKATRWLIIGLLALYFIISAFIDRDLTVIISKGVVVALAALCTILINEKKNDFFYTIAIDGIMLLQFLVMYLFWIIK